MARQAFFVSSAVLAALAIFGVAVMADDVPLGSVSTPLPWCERMWNETGVIRAPDAIKPEQCRVAVLSGGSFVQLSTAMGRVKGVAAVARGYTGGHHRNPSYEEVCKGKTGHAEAVMVAFDPKATTYREVLDAWLDATEPTPLNAMVAVVGDANYYGPQYRASCFVRAVAERRRFLDATKAYKVRANITTALLVRAIRFSGRFFFESAADADLIETRKRVPQDTRAKERYMRRTRPGTLISNNTEEQGTGHDDALSKEFERLDRDGGLVGAANRSSRRGGAMLNPFQRLVKSAMDASLARRDAMFGNGTNATDGGNRTGVFGLVRKVAAAVKSLAGGNVTATESTNTSSSSSSSSDVGVNASSVAPPPAKSSVDATAVPATDAVVTNSTAMATDGPTPPPTQTEAVV